MSRILVVEDEANIADYLVRGLREEGFDVEHAADGAEATRDLQAGNWDLVLLDWWLPDVDGIDLLRQFRQRDRRTPVLFLTARHEVQCRVQGLNDGADDYLCKPFDFDELLARVRALIRRRESDAGTTLACGDVEVDLATQKVTRAGRPIDLTAKEYSLLVLFLRHPGQVLSRTRIYEQVWDESYEGLSNTLEAHVFDLRRKLEAHGGRLIHTRRGQGYVLDSTPNARIEDAR